MNFNSKSPELQLQFVCKYSLSAVMQRYAYKHKRTHSIAIYQVYYNTEVSQPINEPRPFCHIIEIRLERSL